MKRRWAGWELGSALLAGVLAAAFMPNGFYGDAVSEIVTALGFIMAALVPAMALAATAIRAGGFSVKRIRSLGAAVDVQIKVFAGLFLYSLAACILAILGKLVKWSAPKIVIKAAEIEALDVSFLFPGLLTFLFAFLILRLGTFTAGVLSILRLTTAVAEDEARARDNKSEQSTLDELDSYQTPEGYGTTLPH